MSDVTRDKLKKYKDQQDRGERAQVIREVLSALTVMEHGGNPGCYLYDVGPLYIHYTIGDIEDEP